MNPEGNSQDKRWFENADKKAAVPEFWRRRGKAAKDQGGRERFSRESNLTTALKYRPSREGCGLILLWANKGHHPTPEDPEPDDVGEQSAVAEPISPLLRDAIAKAQIRWSRDAIAQYWQRTREQICRENGGISCAQLEHFGRTPLPGLPERATKWAKNQAKATAPRQRPSRPRIHRQV